MIYWSRASMHPSSDSSMRSNPNPDPNSSPNPNRNRNPNLDGRELRLLDEISLVEEDAVGEGHLVRVRAGVRAMVRSRMRPHDEAASFSTPQP